MRRYVMVAAVSIVALAHVPASAQVRVGARYGHGEGSGVYNVGEVQAGIRAVGPLYITGAFEIIGGNWACAVTPTSPITCGYDGRSISLGPTLALVETRRLRVAGRGSVGWFERTGTYGGADHRGSDHVTISVGLDAAIAVLGPVALQAGVIHRRIQDDLYEETVGEQPHLTAFMVGMGLVFGRRGDGG